MNRKERLIIAKSKKADKHTVKIKIWGSMSDQQNNKEEHRAAAQYVVFEIDKEEYGVKLVDLKEIIKIPELTPLPNAPEFFAGVFNLRGKIIPVIDLEKRFSMKREHPAVPERILIAEQGNDLYGMIVDRVAGTIKIPQNQIQKPQAVGVFKINEAYLDGIATLNGATGRLVIILNIKKILSPGELIALGKQN